MLSTGRMKERSAKHNDAPPCISSHHVLARILAGLADWHAVPMSRERAFDFAEDARLVAASELERRQTVGLFGRQQQEGAELFYVLERLALAIKELCIPDEPLKLSEMRPARKEWWR
jgi:hypothetical protein